MLNFQALYERYAHDVYRFACWLAGDRQQAEDITSETFIRAWTHRGRIQAETLKAYLFTITRNIYLQQKRKDRNRIDFKGVHADSARGPDEMTEAQLTLERIQETLQAFSESDRTAFVLRVLQELSYAEIARILDLSLSAAKVKVYRVRKKLIAEFIDKEVKGT